MIKEYNSFLASFSISNRFCTSLKKSLNTGIECVFEHSISTVAPYFSFSLSCDFNKVTLLETSVFFFLCVPIHLQIIIRLSASTFRFTDKILFESTKGLT